MKVPALAAFLVCSTTLAQAPTSTPPAAATEAKPAASAPTDAPNAAKAPAAGPASTVQLDAAIQAEIDAKVAQAKKELQDEMRAQSATNAATQAGWEDASITNRTKLQLFVAHGYFRVRPELFNYFDLAQPVFNGYYLFPIADTNGGNLPSAINQGSHTITGVNMRFRLEPTINVSEELRIKSQIDMLDNLVWGSTPAYAYSQYQGTSVAFLGTGQVSPVAGVNAALDAVQVKQVYGEVSTPVGLLKFGRMASNFGLGINYNDGSCLDCDLQTDVDAFQFIAEPLPGFFVIPMIQVDVAGFVVTPTLNSAEAYPLGNTNGSTTLRIILARLDTEQQAKAKINSGGSVFNYGLDFAYRTQKYEYKQVGSLPGTPPINTNPNDPYNSISPTLGNRVARFGNLSIPDIWLKFENRTFRAELEAVSYLGIFSAPILPGAPIRQRQRGRVRRRRRGSDETRSTALVVLTFKGGFAQRRQGPGLRREGHPAHPGSRGPPAPRRSPGTSTARSSAATTPARATRRSPAPTRTSATTTSTPTTTSTRFSGATSSGPSPTPGTSGPRRRGTSPTRCRWMAR